MILPRRLIDNYFIFMDSWMPDMLQHTESFERKIYDVLAITEWWPKVSKTDRQTFDVFCDAYYIVTLCLMRNGQRPENWCDDFFDIMGQERNKKGEYFFIEERQWAVMSIVLCVFKHMNEVGLQNLMYRIENRLKKGKGYEVLERMLESTKDGKYRQNREKYAPQDLSHDLKNYKIEWYDYIDVFDNITGEYKSGDIQCLLATLGSGRLEEDVEYHSNEDNYDKARGKWERLCIYDALKSYFKKDESRQEKGSNLDGPVKDFESLWEELEWYRGDLSDWLEGRPRWECEEEDFCDPEAEDEKYVNEIVYPRPDWIDDADNWPALTIESFVYFWDVERKCKSDGRNLVGKNVFANSILNKIKGRGVELGEEPDTLITGFDSHVMQISESEIDGRLFISQQIPDTDILDTDINQTINQLKIEKNNSNKLSKKYYVARVCNDDDVSKMLIRILKEVIKPEISTKKKHSKYSWGHLYNTLYTMELALFFESPADKAKVLHSVFDEINEETIRSRIKNEDLPPGRFTEWNESSPHYSRCAQLAEWLQPVKDMMETRRAYTKTDKE